MQISWCSRQGKARSSNNDAAAIGRKDHYVVAMLVDAAEKGDGQALAQHWSHTVIERALGQTEQLSLAVLISIMRAEHQQLRQHHLHAIASYCCVLVDLQQQLLHVAHVGDCLAGLVQPAKAITWLNRPHNLQEQVIWQGMAPESKESRHLLTRFLNAKRFHAPDCLTTHLAPDSQLLLCSDGYWSEHLSSQVELQNVDDDASALSLRYGEPSIELRSDCENFREYR